MNKGETISEDLLLEIEKDPYYKELIELVPEEDRKELITNIEQMSQALNLLCSEFDELLSTGKGQHDFLNTVGSAINRRAFHDNEGVTEIPWPEKN